MKHVPKLVLAVLTAVMPVKSIVRLMPRAVTWPGHRPRRLSQVAGLAAAATVVACLAAGSASAAPARPARPGTAGSADTAGAGQVSCGPPGFFIQCYTPGQYQVAYGVAPLLKRGITGKGETVAMPELANRPGPNFTDIRKDLAAFDSKFGLPAAKLKVTTTLAGAGAPYVAGTEEVEDTEIVHAIAPSASLDVVLVPANAVTSAADFTAALTGLLHVAITQHAAVVSISGSDGEHLFTPAQVASLHAALRQAAGHQVTVVASSGDTGVISDKGPPKQVSLPASDPLVLGAGGTALGASTSTGAYHGEMAWNADTDASAGGYSSLYPGRPTRTASRAPAGCEASPTSLPTPTPPRPCRCCSPAASRCQPRAPAPPPRCGRPWSPWPTRTPASTSASSTPPSTPSPAAPPITAPSTT